MNAQKKTLFRRVEALLVASALTFALAVPALAEALPDSAANVAAPVLPAGYTAVRVGKILKPLGTHYFHGGLIPILEGADPGMVYMDTKGEFATNNSETYPIGFDYSEGLAPFIWFDKLGYMDVKGEIVIPAQFDVKTTWEGGYTKHAGRFIDGNALVFHETGVDASDNSIGTWTQIDKTGKEVPKTLNEYDAGVIYSTRQGNTAGVTTETLIISGKPTELSFSEGYALLQWGVTEDEDQFGIYYIVSKSGTAGAETPQPSAPETPASVPAKAGTSAVLLDGKRMMFDAYNIGGNNYFKLRDFAFAVSGTAKQFEVTWNQTQNAIELTSGKAYTVVGGECKSGDGTDKAAVPSASAIRKDGAPIELTAYTIGGNNYFKLRDLCQAFDIRVDWDGATNSILIDTTKGYADA